MNGDNVEGTLLMHKSPLLPPYNGAQSRRASGFQGHVATPAVGDSLLFLPLLAIVKAPSLLFNLGLFAW